MAKLFGTDGIRGLANEFLSPELSLKTARAIAHVFENNKGKILVARDTRKSGDMIESAIIAGLTSMGVDVEDLGIIPTPGLALMIKIKNASAGIMISASHNPGYDNGIKVFDENALKINDKTERQIEEYINNPHLVEYRPVGEKVGKLVKNEDALEELKNYYKEQFPLDLRDYKIAIDSGNGANYIIAPELFKEMGAEVIAINIDPDGMNINDNSGSTNPELISKLVKENHADIGLSFDGDGDRLILSDENGNIIDGDHIMSILANYLKSQNRLMKNAVVATVMSNMGLDEYLNGNSIHVHRTSVGDKYILEKLLKENLSLGAEQSGHIIIMDYNTTGDSIASSLLLLEAMISSKSKLSNLDKMLEYPQVLLNARIKNENKKQIDSDELIISEVSKIEKLLSTKGRVLIRPSGTEPVIRVMVESKDGSNIEEYAKNIVNIIEDRLGG